MSTLARTLLGANKALPRSRAISLLNFCAVKIVREESLISCGPFATSKEWKGIRAKLHKAIKAVASSRLTEQQNR